MFDNKEKRFKVKEDQGLGLGAIYIIVDTVTGVNYIATVGTTVSGITPLLDGNVTQRHQQKAA